MWVEPNTNILLLHNVPLDTTYDHTIFFANKNGTGGQTTYFQNMVKYSFTSQTYQRVRRGVARLQRPAEDLYDCNYMMFQNTAFGNKWFYAFVKSVEYINNVTSEIEFEIDVMQTWHFDYTLDSCFVERQHTTTDQIGDHIEAEPVALGETVFNGWERLSDFSDDLLIVVAVAEVDTPTPTPDPEDPEDPDPEPTPVWSEGKIYDGVYGGLTLYAYHLSEVNQVNALIASKIQTPDAIQAIWMCPNTLLSISLTDHKIAERVIAQPVPLDVSPSAITTSATLDGYTPKNKKLYTYPYNYYHVDNLSGKGLDIRYEFCRNLTPDFVVYGSITQPVKIVLRPNNYKLRGTGLAYSHMDYTESLTLENFPQCSWNMDAYWAWVAQNAVPETLNLGTALLSGITSFFGGGDSTNKGAGLGVLSSSVGSLSRDYQASIKSDICKGSLYTGSVNVASGYMDFYGTRVSVNRNFARQIDDFFSRFGYAINRLQVPERNARPFWTYVKTAGCTITGSVPCDDMKKICQIYDTGITWWNDPAKVGHYNNDNSPRT